MKEFVPEYESFNGHIAAYIDQIEKDIAAHDALREGWDLMHRPSTVCGLPMLGGLQEEGSFIAKARYMQTMLENNPQAAEAILSNRVVGFHGTSSAALYGILCESGLITAQRAHQYGIPLSTGERLISERTGQDSISFADWRATDTLAHYSQANAGQLTTEILSEQLYDLDVQITKRFDFLYSIGLPTEEDDYLHNLQQQAAAVRHDRDFLAQNPQGLEADLMRLNFPMLFGVNIDQLPRNANDIDDAVKSELAVIDASARATYGEFRVLTSNGKLTFDQLPVVAVPWEYTGYVQELFEDCATSVVVVSLEAIIPDSSN